MVLLDGSRRALGVLALGALFASGALAAPGTLWVPEGIDLDGPSLRYDVYYEGMSGRIVGSDTDLSELVDRGATSLGMVPGDVTLYVFLVEDAERATFEAPARVILRSDHEVLLITSGEVPRLTDDARESQRGLSQPIRLSWEPVSVTPTLPEPQPRVYDPLIQQMVDAVTNSGYHATWQVLDDFETRHTMTPQNEQATQWILDEFLAMGLQAEFHYYQQSGQRRNVVATLPGLVDPSRVVYLCGHMDSTSPTPETCAPGADDDGSGSAAVIEAARIFSQYAFEYTVKFVCFNGEEQGLVGSGAYVSDIAQAGEDVIGAFNMDMIAYAGTDALPYDLVIYTNSASQSLATALTEAVDLYVPGAVEPIVHVENMGGSDHASFWSHGYPAVASIEDEAWGSDFCPWYHTCDDRIEQYPTQYPVDCTKVNVAAAAMTAGALPVDGPSLIISDMDVDDDATGASIGDGDGTVNPGETIELWITLENIGNEAATGISGELTTTSTSVQLLNANTAWGDIPASGFGTNMTALLFEVDGTAVNGEPIPLTLTVTYQSGSRPLDVSVTVVAPDVAYYFHELDDTGSATPDGVLNSGETVSLPVTVGNWGGKNATDVVGTLSSLNPYVTVIEGSATVPGLFMGATAELSPAFQVQVSGSAPSGEVIRLDLGLSAEGGYQAASTFNLKVGAFFYDDAEADGAWTLGIPGDDATTGRWTRVDPNGTTQDGQPCQTENDHTLNPGVECYVTGQGAVGGSAGGADVDGGKTTLITPVFDLTGVAQPEIAYWRWYTNNLGGSPGNDQWVVQISDDGGSTWVDLERTTASNNSWQLQTFLVADYVTPTANVVLQFVASDEGDGSLVEGAVDDFEIGSAGPEVGVGSIDLAQALWLGTPRPMPVRYRATISYGVPGDDRVSLIVFDVSGRRVRTLVQGPQEPGVHHVEWDGRTDGGATASPGVYFYRLSVAGETQVRRLVVVR